MKITISQHTIKRAIKRFPALNIPIKEINAILYAIAHRGQPIRSMRFGERYQVGVLADGSPIILAMKEGLADQWTVTTVMHDRQVIPHAILGETAKAVEAARKAAAILSGARGVDT